MDSQIERKTFDPISGPFSSLPAPQPGNTIVAYKGDHTEVVSNRMKSGLVSKVTENVEPKVLGVVVGVTFLLWLMTNTVIVALSLLTLAFASVYLFDNRDSLVAKIVFGDPPTYYLVDGARREIVDARRVQLENTGIFAEIHFEYMARVIDPEKVVLEGVRDVREYLSRRIYSEIQKIASRGSLDDKLQRLRKELFDFANESLDDDMFQISDMMFDLYAEGKIAGELEKIAEQDLRIRGIDAAHKVQDRERRYYEQLLENDERLFAEMMRPGSDRVIIQGALRSKLERSSMEYDQKLSLLKAAMEHGILEPHQIENQYPQFMSGLMDNFNELSTAKNGIKAVEADTPEKLSVDQEEVKDS